MTSRSDAVQLVLQRIGNQATPRLAVLGRQRRDQFAADLEARIPEAVVHSFDLGLDSDQLHVRLAAAGPFDLVVDLGRRQRADVRLPRGLYSLRRSGWLLLARPARRDDDVLALIDRLRSIQGGGSLAPPVRPRDPRPRRERDLHAMAASIASVQMSADFAAIELQENLLAKIPEHLADEYLSHRPEAGQVLERVPGQTWSSLGELDGSDPDRVRNLPRDFHGPSLSLRLLSHVICAPWSCVIQDNVVLPETYRVRNPRLRGQALSDWSDRFDRSPGWQAKPLAGEYYHLDNEWRGHFGHALSEQASKLWGWHRAKAQIPELKALMFRRPGHPAIAAWEEELWAAAGIRPDDLVVPDGPVAIETLVTASPAYTNPGDHHPIFRETLDQIGSALGSAASMDQWPGRVFLSRRRTHDRWCHNTGELESLMRDYGFEVVYPQDFNLADQVGFVRNADVVGGFIGSGMYPIGYAGSPKHVIAISSENYTALGEVRMSALLGHRLDLVWSRADLPPSSTYDRDSFLSDFTFDVDAEGRYLRGVLDGLN